MEIPAWMRERLERYGTDLVETPAARRIFIDICRGGLEAAGFSLERDRRFARVATPDITHLIELQPWKGQQFAFRWGVSLSFLPHRWTRRPEYHRTLRSARMDLFHMLADDLADHDPHPGRREGQIDGLHGEAVLRRDLEDAWDALRERMLHWLGAAADVEAIAAMAAQQAERIAQGSVGHSPSPLLVQAFCLARLGRRSEAAATLALAIDYDGSFLEPLDRLRAAFATVLDTATVTGFDAD